MGKTSSTQNPMAASSARPLSLHARRDLSIQQQTYQGRDYWVVKDPLSLKYYRFEDEEFSLLQMLDGVASADQIKRKFDYEFAPQKISLQELYQFVGSLYRNSLLVSEAPNQGIELKRRGEKNRHAEFRQSLTNILAIRCKGFDPDRLLGGVNRWCGWFFTWPAFVCVLLLGICAGGLLVTQFETFQSKLPNFQDFFAAKNWIWLALVMAATKILHEFGHGMACKKFGGQCHEMGFMLLVLTPCLYVNVSDSWLLPDKWKRAFIAAAGMYVELVLASMAVFVWWFSLPGMVNQLALNVIFICSVSTLLFNANPLLRYDGYYILSDLLEIPNLRAKATSILQRTAGQWLLGIEVRPDPFLPVRQQWLFAIFSIAAAAYRWVITFSIFWFMYRLMEPYGFKIVGQLIALTAIYGLVGMPLVQLYKFFSVPGRFGTVKPIRVTVSAIAIVAILAAMMLIPIPHHVYCSFYVQPRHAANVYVDVPGRLEMVYTQPNCEVEENQPILVLSSQKLTIQLASMQTKLDLAKTEHENVLQARSSNDNEAQRIEEVQASVQTASANLAKRLGDVERLVVRAPVKGYFIPPARIKKRKTDSGELGRWHGTPLEERNIGAYLDQQTFVGQIVPDMTALEAVLAIDQSDIEFVRADQPVEMLIHQLPAKTHHSVTQRIAPSKMKSVPKALSSRFGGDIVSTTDAEGADVPQSTKFLVSVPLDNSDQIIVPNSTGVAKIRAGSQTLGQRIWRWVNHTFQFEL
jgi:putative peptide zinc metalloprotease protein